MATIKTIIDQARTLADDYCDVNTFIFDEVACFNDDRGKEYPVVLIESRGIDKSVVDLTNFLPSKKQYTLRFYFADMYLQSDINAGKTKEEAYEDVERYADQYLAEFKRRLLDDETIGVYITGVRNGFVTDKAFNDCLVYSVCDVDFIVESDCVEGQFSGCP